jgi:hypothetical protein
MLSSAAARESGAATDETKQLLLFVRVVECIGPDARRGRSKLAQPGARGRSAARGRRGEVSQR